MRMCRGDNCFHWNEWSFLICFRHWANFFRKFVDKFLTLFSKRHAKTLAVWLKLHSTCRQEEFGRKYFFQKDITFVLIILGKWPKFLRLFAKHFSAGLSERLSEVLCLCPKEQFEEEHFYGKIFLIFFLELKSSLRTFGRQICFIEKNDSFLINFVYWSNVFRLLEVKLLTWLSKCYSKCSAVLSKLHFTLPYEQFGEKFF